MDFWDSLGVGIEKQLSYLRRNHDENILLLEKMRGILWATIFERMLLWATFNISETTFCKELQSVYIQVGV